MPSAGRLGSKAGSPSLGTLFKCRVSSILILPVPEDFNTKSSLLDNVSITDPVKRRSSNSQRSAYN